MNYEKMMKDWDDSIPEGVKRMSKTNREQELKIRTLEAEIERLKTVLTEIRDLALTWSTRLINGTLPTIVGQRTGAYAQSSAGAKYQSLTWR